VILIDFDMMALSAEKVSKEGTTTQTSSSDSAAVVEGIFCTATAGSPMQSCPKDLLVAGVGLQGDRYAQKEGTYSVVVPKEPGRQLTLISADSVEQSLTASGKTLTSIGSLRRNIVLRGSAMTALDLIQGIGKVLALGSTARVFIHRNCVPCMYNEKRNQCPGMMEALWDVAGVNCEVLVGGEIAVGDVVRFLDPNEYPGHLPLPEDGHKPASFYIRPSQRTLAMVKEGLEEKRQSKVTLTELDPQGVARAEACFAAVGLSFFPPDKT